MGDRDTIRAQSQFRFTADLCFVPDFVPVGCVNRKAGMPTSSGVRPSGAHCLSSLDPEASLDFALAHVSKGRILLLLLAGIIRQEAANSRISTFAKLGRGIPT